MKLKLTLAALTGLVVGIAAMWLLVARTTGRVFVTQYLVSVADQANVALHIRAGKQWTLVTNIEASLPDYVLTVAREFPGHAEATNALWMIKAHYERNALAVPAEIKGILGSLPAKPPTACVLRLRALDGAAATNKAKAGGAP